jgi:predicted  nucleic acid-binding Zn-ribbon protein
LSEKYARLSEQAVVLQQKTKDLIAENHRLKTQLTTSQAELNQTQKELTEANDLLIEMRIELNNWKIDILGFRDEIRNADKAQLETLLKILKILGGEVKNSKVASANQPGKTQLKDTPASGNSNE